MLGLALTEFEQLFTPNSGFQTTWQGNWDLEKEWNGGSPTGEIGRPRKERGTQIQTPCNSLAERQTIDFGGTNRSNRRLFSYVANQQRRNRCGRGLRRFSGGPTHRAACACSLALLAKEDAESMCFNSCSLGSPTLEEANCPGRQQRNMKCPGAPTSCDQNISHHPPRFLSY